MLTCLIYFTITFLIPARLTYNDLKDHKDRQGFLWANYWAVYAFVILLKSLLPFLQ